MKRREGLIVQNKESGNIQSSFDYVKKFNIPLNSKILDIGCNYGSLIYNLLNQGYNHIWGIDLNENAISKGKENYPEIIKNLIKYDGSKIPFEDNSFDVILMFDVIEHIPSIERFLKEEVYRVLKKGGIFIFQTPNKPINILWICIANKSLSNKESWKDHCSLQTFFSFKKLLQRSGFININLEKYNIDTLHNRQKLKSKVGIFGGPLLRLALKLPLLIYPNLWGFCRK